MYYDLKNEPNRRERIAKDLLFAKKIFSKKQDQMGIDFVNDLEKMMKDMDKVKKEIKELEKKYNK